LLDVCHAPDCASLHPETALKLLVYSALSVVLAPIYAPWMGAVTALECATARYRRDNPDHLPSVKLAAIHATIKSGTKASKIFWV
jgi:hypothetical protein